MNLQSEAIHLEQKSKKKGHSASAWYLPWGMCVCLCAHPFREVLMYKSSLKRKKRGLRFCLYIRALHWLFFKSAATINTVENQNIALSDLPPQPMSKYLCITVQTLLPHGRYSFICNLKVVLSLLVVHAVKDFLRLFMQAFHSFLFYLFYETNSHCESQAALELTV